MWCAVSTALLPLETSLQFWPRSPTIEWTEAEGGPYGGVSVGPQAVLENVFMKLAASGMVSPPLHTSSSLMVPLSSRWVSDSGTYKATGKSFTAPFAHVWKLQDGKAISFHQ